VGAATECAPSTWSPGHQFGAALVPPTLKMQRSTTRHRTFSESLGESANQKCGAQLSQCLLQGPPRTTPTNDSLGTILHPWVPTTLQCVCVPAGGWRGWFYPAPGGCGGGDATPPPPHPQSIIVSYDMVRCHADEMVGGCSSWPDYVHSRPSTHKVLLYLIMIW